MKIIRHPKLIKLFQERDDFYFKEKKPKWSYNPLGIFFLFSSGLKGFIYTLNSTFVSLLLFILFLILGEWLRRRKIFPDIRTLFFYETGGHLVVNFVYFTSFIIFPIFLIIDIFIPFKFTLELIFFSDSIVGCILGICTHVYWIKHRHDEFKFEPDPNYISWEAMVQRYFDKR